MRPHQLFVLALSLMVLMPSSLLSAPVGSTGSTGRNYDELDAVEVFRQNAHLDGIRNLEIVWPAINPVSYSAIRDGIRAWTSKGKRIMFLHYTEDGRALKALIALPRTPTWNGWLNRIEGQLDYGVITIHPGNVPVEAHHLEGIIKVTPSSVNQLDAWFSRHAHTLAELRASHLGRV